MAQSFEFTDGTPLDAANLNSLVQEFNLVRSSIPQVGRRPGQSSLENSLQPQIFGGLTGKQKVTAGKKEKFVANFEGFFSIPPQAVVANVSSPSGGLANEEISVTIGEIRTDSADIYVYYKTGDKKEYMVNIYFVAILHG